MEWIPYAVVGLEVAMVAVEAGMLAATVRVNRRAADDRREIRDLLAVETTTPQLPIAMQDPPPTDDEMREALLIAKEAQQAWEREYERHHRIQHGPQDTQDAVIHRAMDGLRLRKLRPDEVQLIKLWRAHFRAK